MNRSTSVLGSLLLSVVFISACQQEAEQAPATPAPQASAPQPQMVDLAPLATTDAPAGGMVNGTVAETIDAAGYTYVRVEVDGQSLWAAGPATAMATGDTISFSTLIPMRNFHSTAMNRDFAVLYFVDGFTNLSTSGTSAAASASATAPVASTAAIEKVDGGYTIAEALAQKAELAGKPIKVRGKVTKFTSGIMGKNWIHIEDGSGAEDLIVTTSGSAAMGSVIVAEGALSLDRDFGYGYHYAVLMEDARVTTE
ncbi:MAG: DNA-binding protein [Gammaproteobacteria bacterium]|nr:DNA-binding protein [Gammaproteobacteria bacterium]